MQTIFDDESEVLLPPQQQSSHHHQAAPRVPSLRAVIADVSNSISESLHRSLHLCTSEIDSLALRFASTMGGGGEPPTKALLSSSSFVIPSHSTFYVSGSSSSFVAPNIPFGGDKTKSFASERQRLIDKKVTEVANEMAATIQNIWGQTVEDVDHHLHHLVGMFLAETRDDVNLRLQFNGAIEAAVNPSTGKFAEYVRVENVKAAMEAAQQRIAQLSSELQRAKVLLTVSRGKYVKHRAAMKYVESTLMREVVELHRQLAEATAMLAEEHHQHHATRRHSKHHVDGVGSGDEQQPHRSVVEQSRSGNEHLMSLIDFVEFVDRSLHHGEDEAADQLERMLTTSAASDEANRSSKRRAPMNEAGATRTGTREVYAKAPSAVASTDNPADGPAVLSGGSLLPSSLHACGQSHHLGRASEAYGMDEGMLDTLVLKWRKEMLSDIPTSADCLPASAADDGPLTSMSSRETELTQRCEGFESQITSLRTSFASQITSFQKRKENLERQFVMQQHEIRRLHEANALMEDRMAQNAKECDEVRSSYLEKEALLGLEKVLGLQQLQSRSLELDELEQRLSRERTKLNVLLDRMANGNYSSVGLEQLSDEDNLVYDYLRSAREMQSYQSRAEEAEQKCVKADELIKSLSGIISERDALLRTAIPLLRKHKIALPPSLRQHYQLLLEEQASKGLAIGAGALTEEEIRAADEENQKEVHAKDFLSMLSLSCSTLSDVKSLLQDSFQVVFDRDEEAAKALEKKRSELLLATSGKAKKATADDNQAARSAADVNSASDDDPLQWRGTFASVWDGAMRGLSVAEEWLKSNPVASAPEALPKGKDAPVAPEHKAEAAPKHASKVPFNFSKSALAPASALVSREGHEPAREIICIPLVLANLFARMRSYMTSDRDASEKAKGEVKELRQTLADLRNQSGQDKQQLTQLKKTMEELTRLAAVGGDGGVDSASMTQLVTLLTGQQRRLQFEAKSSGKAPANNIAAGSQLKNPFTDRDVQTDAVATKNAESLATPSCRDQGTTCILLLPPKKFLGTTIATQTDAVEAAPPPVEVIQQYMKLLESGPQPLSTAGEEDPLIGEASLSRRKSFTSSFARRFSSNQVRSRSLKDVALDVMNRRQSNAAPQGEVGHAVAARKRSVVMAVDDNVTGGDGGGLQFMGDVLMVDEVDGEEGSSWERVICPHCGGSVKPNQLLPAMVTTSKSTQTVHSQTMCHVGVECNIVNAPQQATGNNKPEKPMKRIEGEARQVLLPSERAAPVIVTMAKGVEKAVQTIIKGDVISTASIASETSTATVALERHLDGATSSVFGASNASMLPPRPSSGSAATRRPTSASGSVVRVATEAESVVDGIVSVTAVETLSSPAKEPPPRPVPAQRAHSASPAVSAPSLTPLYARPTTAEGGYTRSRALVDHIRHRPLSSSSKIAKSRPLRPFSGPSVQRSLSPPKPTFHHKFPVQSRAASAGDHQLRFVVTTQPRHFHPVETSVRPSGLLLKIHNAFISRFGGDAIATNDITSAPQQ